MRIAIVGGGPAGSYLGYCLASKGMEATIFDDSHPREKPCGGGLSSYALRKFPILRGLPSGKVGGRRMFLVSPSGREAMVEGKEEGWNVSRASLDGYLLGRATDAGARLVEERVLAVEKGSEWKIKTGKGFHKADILIGADGVNSLVRKSLIGPFRKEDLCFCYGFFTDVSRELEELEGIMKFYKGMMGYAWLFPRETDCSIGIGTDVEHMARAKIELEAFRKKYAGNVKVFKKWGALIPMARTADFFRSPASGKDWLLIGDAAGHVNPITGEGILYALWSAKLAANALERMEPESYDALWRREYGWDLIKGVEDRSLFYNRIGIELSLFLAKRSPKFGKFIYDAINSEVDAHNFMKRLIRESPSMIFECIKK
jgi:geranylgeranyl reductase family protein